jgi:hypothetical protein
LIGGGRYSTREDNCRKHMKIHGGSIDQRETCDMDQGTKRKRLGT